MGEYITAITMTIETTDPNKPSTTSPYVVSIEVRKYPYPKRRNSSPRRFPSADPRRSTRNEDTASC
jgi:hypothetical protein